MTVNKLLPLFGLLAIFSAACGGDPGHYRANRDNWQDDLYIHEDGTFEKVLTSGTLVLIAAGGTWERNGPYYTFEGWAHPTYSTYPQIEVRAFSRARLIQVPFDPTSENADYLRYVRQD